MSPYPRTPSGPLQTPALPVLDGVRGDIPAECSPAVRKTLDELEGQVARLTAAVLDGRWMVRVSIGSMATERTHVEALWRDMRAAVEA